MASRSAKGHRTGSPLKKSQSNANNNSSQVQHEDYSGYHDRDLVKGLTEREVENDHLRTTIVALSEQVAVCNDLKRDVVVHKELIRDSESKRGELQVHITETSIRIQHDTTEHRSYQEHLIADNESLRSEIQSLKQYHSRKEQDWLHQFEDTNVTHKKKVDQLTREHHDALSSLSNESAAKIDRLQRENHDKLTQVTQQSEQKLAQVTLSCEQQVAQVTNQSNAQLAQTTADFEAKLAATTKECEQKVAQITREYEQKLTNASNDYNTKLSQVTHQYETKLAQVTSDANSRINSLTNENQVKLLDAERSFHEKLEQLRRENKAREDQWAADTETLRQQRDSRIRQLEREKEEQRGQYEVRINDLDSKIKRQTQKILELNSTVIELREVITQKRDVEAQLDRAREQISHLDSQKSQLIREIETASDYIMEMEDKVYKANKTSLELLRQLKDAEIEIETLKNYIIELKQRIAVYIPVKDDPIDKRLAEFINNYPERQKLKIMFMRESEGVYQFGTKRVWVRVDKDKINIRVGGGYLSIDEFLDQYTPAELEKLERKDPLKKFSEKIAVQKTIIGKEVRETSPLRSPTRESPGRQSPGKRAAI